MPHVILYGAANQKPKSENEPEFHFFIMPADISFIEIPGNQYQRERSFIYGDPEEGHAVAVIVCDRKEIPYGVISQEINKKQLPVVFLILNKDGQKSFADYAEFLWGAHACLVEDKINSFCIEKANVSIVDATDLEPVETALRLDSAIREAYSEYLKQPEESRRSRPEAAKPTAQQMADVKEKFSQVCGMEKALSADTLDIFRTQVKQQSRGPVATFFGAINPPKNDICQWARALTSFSLLYGLGGADKNKQAEQQSVMYQFVHSLQEHSQSPVPVFGVIPYEQVRWEMDRDFRGLNICAYYITPDLGSRLEAFDKVSDLIIVGSTGTGTYEEILDILRRDPARPVIIINSDNSNTPLVKYLESFGKDVFKNIHVASNYEAFEKAVDHCFWQWQAVYWGNVTFEHMLKQSLFAGYQTLKTDHHDLYIYDSNRMKKA